VRLTRTTPRTWQSRLATLAVAACLALVADRLAAGWYVHGLTARYAQANGPLWTAEVQQAWGNVLDPLWEANHGSIIRLAGMLGLDSEKALRAPMELRRLSARLTGESVDTGDGETADPDAIPLVYAAPPSLLERMRERDSYLGSQAGRRLLAAMAGFRKRRALDDTYYDTAPRTVKAQIDNNPYATDGFRTYSFFALVRYAILRYEDGAHEARLWYMNQLCADDGADWDYDRAQAMAALRKAGYTPPPCIGRGLQAHVQGYHPPPTFAARVAGDPQLPDELWGAAAKRFGIDVFAAVLMAMLVVTGPVMGLARAIANRVQRQ
jgi:hypothetical protein